MYKSKKQIMAEICAGVRREMDKERCRKEERRNKTVKLSKYIEKEDGTLVPKPKVITQLEGVQPRLGGFVVDSPWNREISSPYKEKLGYFGPDSKALGTQQESSMSLLSDLSDLFIPIDEENIVDHFERLLLFMEVLAKNPMNIKEKDASCVIQFLKSIKTPNDQLAPNAQAMVNYIEHILDKKVCDAKNSQEKEQESIVTDDGDNAELVAKICSKINDQTINGGCFINTHKHRKSCNSKSRNGSTEQRRNKNQEKVGETSTNPSPQRTNVQKPDKPNDANPVEKSKDDLFIKDMIWSMNSLYKPPSLKNMTKALALSPVVVANRVLKVETAPTASTRKEVTSSPKKKVHPTLPIEETFTAVEALNNTNCIGDCSICGDEIVQACHEPLSRSLSPDESCE